MPSEINKEWQEWIITSFKNGIEIDEIASTMIDAGIDKEIASDEVTKLKIQEIAEVLELKRKEKESKRIIYALFKRVFYKLGIYHIKLLNLENAIKYDSSEVELYILNNFLSDDECHKVFKLIKTKLEPSKIVSEDDYDDTIRTSKTCNLGLLESPLIDNIDERICSKLNIDQTLSEVMQGQLYEVGEEFKPHHDYFDGSEKIIAKHTRAQGQRTYTCMIYLNDVEEGGETFFPFLSRAFYPKKGQALIWNNLSFDGMPNKQTLHQGKPVLKGSKAIITKWFREAN